MARRGSFAANQSARAVSHYALPPRPEPTMDVFAASVYTLRWEHRTTHAATTFYVLALSPAHAVELGRIRVAKMGGADDLHLMGNTRSREFSWPFVEMLLQAESQEEKDSRLDRWHEMQAGDTAYCAECGEPWAFGQRQCSCDAPSSVYRTLEAR